MVHHALPLSLSIPPPRPRPHTQHTQHTQHTPPPPTHQPLLRRQRQHYGARDARHEVAGTRGPDLLIGGGVGWWVAVEVEWSCLVTNLPTRHPPPLNVWNQTSTHPIKGLHPHPHPRTSPRRTMAKFVELQVATNPEGSSIRPSSTPALAAFGGVGWLVWRAG